MNCETFFNIHFSAGWNVSTSPSLLCSHLKNDTTLFNAPKVS